MARPLEDGDLRGLTPGTARHYVASEMRLVADAGYRGLGLMNAQYVALVTGANVVLTDEQVRAFLPASEWPASIDDYPRWRLTGANELTPAE